MKFVICLLVILGLGGATLAQENTPTPIIIPLPTLITDPWPFPDGLFCADAEVGLGPTWGGITIGESTLDDLQSLMKGLSDNYTFRDDGHRGVIFYLFSEREASEKRI